MSRSNYSDDCEQWDLIRWRGAVKSAIRGSRGQAFLRDLLEALEALPVKRLIANELEKGGEVCAIGALGKARGVDMSAIDPEDAAAVAGRFYIAYSLACEVVFKNDEGALWGKETPEARYERMLKWVQANLTPERP